MHVVALNRAKGFEVPYIMLTQKTIGKPLILCFTFPSLGAVIPTHINISASVGDQLGTRENHKVGEILGIELGCSETNLPKL